MTAAEKIHLLKGSGMKSAIGMGDPTRGIPGAVGTIVPTPRLGIPAIYLSDGPAGLRSRLLEKMMTKPKQMLHIHLVMDSPTLTLNTAIWNPKC